MNAPVLGAVVIASATAWMVLRLLLGNSPLFKVPQYELHSNIEFLIYAVLGVLGGAIAAAFSRLLLGIRQRFLRFPRSTVWFQPVAGGLLVGAMGWFVPQVMGVGYTYVGDVLNGRMALTLMLVLVVLKLLAVTVSYASGNAGGIFAPSLFIGAMLGGAVGTVAHQLWPAYTANAGAYALVGMGAVFAGIVRTPMTSVLIIFEMTQDYAIIVPLMIANLISLFIASLLQKQPIYQALAVQDGIHLPTAASRWDRGQRNIAQVLRTAEQTLPAEMTIQDAQAKLKPNAQADPHETLNWIVADERGVVGVLSWARLEKETDGTKRLLDLVDPLTFPHVHADQSLDLALERMGANQIEILPVVGRADAHRLEGIVTLRDVLDAYGVGMHEVGLS
jgi:CIC family chloride channel protein